MTSSTHPITDMDLWVMDQELLAFAHQHPELLTPLDDTPPLEGMSPMEDTTPKKPHRRRLS